MDKVKILCYSKICIKQKSEFQTQNAPQAVYYCACAWYVLFSNFWPQPLADSVDLPAVARRTPGFTGADLSNLLNEAAIAAAARGSLDGITAADVDGALERLQVGPEKPGHHYPPPFFLRLKWHLFFFSLRPLYPPFFKMHST